MTTVLKRRGASLKEPRASGFGPERGVTEGQSSGPSHSEHSPSARAPLPCARRQSLHFRLGPWERRKALWTSHTVRPAGSTVVCWYVGRRLLYVRNFTHNRQPRYLRFLQPQAQTLADGVRTGPAVLGELVVNDCHQLRVRRVR